MPTESESHVRSVRPEVQALLSAVGQPALLCDVKSLILVANRGAESLHGNAAGALVGRHLTEISDPRPGHRYLTEDAAIDRVLSAINDGEEIVYQAWHRRVGAGRFPVTVTIRPIQHAGNEPRNFLVFIRDEHESDGQSARMRLALDDAETVGRMKTDVLKRAGHDLRTPLTAILGFCDLLLLDHPPGSEMGSILSRIRRSGAELDRQFARLIDFFKLLDGILPIDIGNVAPAQVVQDACRRWQDAVTSASLEFRQAIDDSVDRVCVTGDAQRIAAIIDELMSNAIQSTSSGMIEIGACRSDQKVIFFVSDQGSGFPFYGPQGMRAPPDAGEVGEGRSGLGIGLPMAQRLAVAQGATLRLAESGPNGSRMELALPIYKEI